MAALSDILRAAPEGATFDELAVAAAAHGVPAADLLTWWRAQHDAGVVEPGAALRGIQRYKLAS